MRTDQIALQLYTIRDHTAQDMAGTLQKVAAMGYKSVELAGYGNAADAKEVRQLLDANGLRAIAAHTALNALEAENALDDLKTLGVEYAVLPWLAPEFRNAETARDLGPRLNSLAEKFAAAGIGLAYHNHDFEFAPLEDGGTFFELLLSVTDPALVKLELDVYWAQFAGQDVAALINANAERIALLHMKDMAADEKRGWAIVGEGTMPWPGILAAGEAAGVKWYVVEHDRPTDPLADVERGIRNLESWAK